MERFGERYDAGKYFPARDIAWSLKDIFQNHLVDRSMSKEDRKTQKKIDELIEEYRKYFSPLIEIRSVSYQEFKYNGFTFADEDNPYRTKMQETFQVADETRVYFPLYRLMDSVETPGILKQKLLKLVEKYEYKKVNLEMINRLREAGNVRDEKYNRMRDKTIKRECENICAKCHTEKEAILEIETKFGRRLSGPFVHEDIDGQEIIKGVIFHAHNSIGFVCKLIDR